ncbi:MAG: TetR/AcrR family transcriptional regulator [Clostridia bacterium]|nr:TetR/AcrR family transcriptional regulator [Clostridia bacterium]
MAPKNKVRREEIVVAALELIRDKGAEALNARDLAAALGCSTQPIFSNFASMDEIRAHVIAAATELYGSYIRDGIASEKYPPYKASGMAYIEFASREKELFKLLFMRDRTAEDKSPTGDFDSIVDIIVKNTGFDRETATFFHLEMWVSVHGIAVMMATNYLELGMETVSEMLSDIYIGLRSRYERK